MSVRATTQLRRLFRIVNGGTPTVDESNWDGDVPWATPVDLGRVDGGTLMDTDRRLTDLGLRSGSRSVPAGSLILSVRAPVGYVAAVDRPTAFNQGCKGLVPVVELDHRFHRYQLISLKGRLSSESQGSTFVELSGERLAQIPLHSPAIEEQRRIADHLDAETGRIDALITKRQRQIELLAEHHQRTVEELVWSGDDVRLVRLKYLTGAPTSGNRDHASFTLLDEGIPCLRGLNVRPGRIDRADLLRISPADHRRHAPTVLRHGDVVLVRSGAAGAAAVVPPDLDDCNCVDLVIVRRSPTVLPRYLEIVINSQRTQSDVRSRTAGAILSHFNAVDVANLVLPSRSLEAQRRACSIVDDLERRLGMLTETFSRQIELLRERRQALITAMVTGVVSPP